MTLNEWEEEGITGSYTSMSSDSKNVLITEADTCSDTPLDQWCVKERTRNKNEGRRYHSESKLASQCNSF